MTIDFSYRIETEEDYLGPRVVLVRKLFNGDTHQEAMPAVLAVWLLGNDPLNGLVYKSGKIEWGGVFDEWSQSI